MSRKALTRFYVRHNGINAELFAVHENPNGDLTIKHRPIFYERNLFRYMDSAEVEFEKYSVHVSPNSSGHVITHTTTFKGDPDKRSSWFVECDGDPFLTCIYSRRQTSLIESLFKMSIRENDKRVCVAKFDVTKSSLITHVFVGARDGIQLDQLGLPFDIVTHRFRLFEIHVVKAFLPYPSLQQGCHTEPGDRTNHQTLSPEAIAPFIAGRNADLQSTFLPRAITEILNSMGDELAKMPIGVPGQGPLLDRLNSLYFANRVERSPLD